jgi:RNA polymerase sigma factor (sigma-70 family)
MRGVLRSEATVRDAAGFEALYVAHRRHVVAYCLRRSPRCDAYEAADETLLIAWRRFEEIPSGQERAWLYGVARRVLSNQHRGDHRRGRLNRRLAQHRVDAFPDPEAQTLQSAERQVLWGAYRRVSADDQEVLRLAAWEELPHDQIGVALDCTAGAARQPLHRARGRLAGEFERTERPLAGARRHHDG